MNRDNTARARLRQLITREDFLAGLSLHKPVVAVVGLRAPFAFDDIAKLEDHAIQRTLKEVESKTLVLALIASTDELMGRVLRNMGSRAGLLVREEIEILGPQRLGDIENAQRDIANIVLALAEHGHRGFVMRYLTIAVDLDNTIVDHRCSPGNAFVSR